jgi:hypothetical protein
MFDAVKRVIYVLNHLYYVEEELQERANVRGAVRDGSCRATPRARYANPLYSQRRGERVAAYGRVARVIPGGLLNAASFFIF